MYNQRLTRMLYASKTELMLPSSFGAQRNNMGLFCSLGCYVSITLGFGAKRSNRNWFKTQFCYHRSGGEPSTVSVTFGSNDSKRLASNVRQVHVKHVMAFFVTWDDVRTLLENLYGPRSIKFCKIWAGLLSQRPFVSQKKKKNSMQVSSRRCTKSLHGFFNTNWFLTSADFTHAYDELRRPIKSLEIRITIDVLGFVILAPNIKWSIKKSQYCASLSMIFPQLAILSWLWSQRFRYLEELLASNFAMMESIHRFIKGNYINMASNRILFRFLSRFLW